MPRCRFLCCSDSAIIDKFTNNLSIIGVLHSLSGASFPLWRPELVLSAIFSRSSDEESQIEVNLVLSKGKTPIQTFPVVLDFGGKLQQTAIIKMHGIEFKGPGELVVAVRVGRKTLASFSIDVTALTASAVPSEASV